MSGQITTDTPLTMSAFTTLSVLVDAAQQTKRVAFLSDVTGEPVWGTARSIGAEGGGFLDDIRNGVMRITMDTGVEQFVSIAELSEDLDVTFFIPNSANQ